MFWAFVLRRFLHTVVTLLLLVTFTFVLFRLIPGDPTTMMLGSGELPVDAQQELRLLLGLDRPLPEQVITHGLNLVQGDFGLSFYYRRPVFEVVWPMLGNTLTLMAPVVMLALAIGIFAGTRLGWRRGSRGDDWGAVVALIPRALPVFWVGIVLLMLFAYQLRWFPIGGMRETFFSPENWWQALPGFDLARHLVLPIATGVLTSLADPLMIQRTAMVDVVNEDFMTHARARGLSRGAQRRLARRNAVLPILTYSAIMIGFAFGGQVLLEVVFTWPGVGRLMVDSVTHRDYPVAQATFTIMATVVIVLNLAVDIAYGLLDPRVRLE